MSDVPRRKWLQVHLSTAVVLMFAAEGIIWANSGVSGAIESETQNTVAYLYGWPLRFLFKFNRDFWNANPDVHESLSYYFGLSYLSISVDLLIGLAILFAVWFVCERWIAWQAGRKKG